MSLLSDLIELSECGSKDKRKALAKKIKSKKKDKTSEEVDNTAYAGKADGWTAEKGW